MGSGGWSQDTYASYASLTRGASVNKSTGRLDGSYSTQEMFTTRHLDPLLNIKNKIRECCDSDEHPNTIPVILGLDVTGSMGRGAVEVAQSLNPIMTKLYSELSDVQIMIMGIGDLAYDDAPIQVSQFESDIRIAEQLDKVYFEAGGGGNGFESYTSAWWIGLNCCSLDCWKRNRKGIIITTGDEPMNPYLPAKRLASITGKGVESDVDTKKLYQQVIQKFDVHHIAIDDCSTCYDGYRDEIKNSWGKLLGEAFHVCKISELEDMIVSIVKDCAARSSIMGSAPLGDSEDDSNNSAGFVSLSNGGISW